jgi:hypothetical protein
MNEGIVSAQHPRGIDIDIGVQVLLIDDRGRGCQGTEEYPLSTPIRWSNRIQDWWQACRITIRSR